MAKSRKLIEKADALIKKEKGTVFKDPGGKFNICLVYPNTYHVGMSSLGFQGVYCMLNAMPGVLCERAFLPDPEDTGEYARSGAELFSLESKRPLREFDMIAFSVSFENDYPNIVRALRLANIPARAGERGPREPLLALGGIMAFTNPEPLADFFDIVFAGEAEAILPGFIGAVRKSSGREGLFKTLARMEGLYLPSLYKITYGPDGKISRREAAPGAPEVIEKKYVSDYRDFRMRHCILTPETEFSNMRLVELMRGCPWDCAFCLTGEVYNPPRRKPKEAIREEIDEAVAAGERVGLIGPSISDYPGINELLDETGVEFSITSLRAGKKSIGLLPSLKRHKKTLSVAAEAGTDRLRQVINKKISEQDILETSGAVLAQGMNLRLYFIAGLPTETGEDIEGIVGLVKKIRASAPAGKITLTVSTFVPKPFTCFQWHPMESQAVVKERLKRIKKGLSDVPGVSVFHDVPKYAYMQGVFAMGDRRLGAVLERMADGLDYKQALKETGLSGDYYIFRKKGFNETLPWDFIDTGMTKKTLWEMFQKALTGPR
ncbi:MAG: radical SAM protein [Nitrospiraceae bacterium]|nr:radical SAM protein [Nitrospiraceae bacterium]